MGNSEKQIFYAKEMLADLTQKPKQMLDPFLIAKLDVYSINHFDFPATLAANSKYTLRNKGLEGLEYLRLCEREALAGIGKSRANT